MKTRTGHSTIDWSTLLTESRDRMSTLFTVAERKTLYSWAPVCLPEAEVVFIDHTLQAQLPPTSQLVFVGGGEPAGTLGRKPAYRLEADFTLSQLIDLLDRMAVLLMDSRTRDFRDPGAHTRYGLLQEPLAPAFRPLHTNP